MRARTLHVIVDGGDYRGKTRSITTLPRSVGSWSTCTACGSTLYPQRFESSKVRTISGSTMTVAKYRCRCGKGQEVRRAA